MFNKSIVVNKVHCPICGARVGELCSTLNGNNKTYKVHVSRKNLYKFKKGKGNCLGVFYSDGNKICNICSRKYTCKKICESLVDVSDLETQTS